MSRAPLRPCARCSRHAWVDETSCPFCGAPVDASLHPAMPPRPPSARLSRAAWFALSSGTATATAACAAASDGAAFKGVIADASVADDGDEGCSPYGDYNTCQPIPLYGSPPSPPPSPVASDASVCRPGVDLEPILASTFGQTCDASADCVAVGVGDPCYACTIRCRGNAAIREAAFPDWQRAMESTPAATVEVSCNCAPPPVACCNTGMCSLSCGPAADGGAGDASATDGGNFEGSIADAAVGEPGAD